jgi:hypothetical protein
MDNWLQGLLRFFKLHRMTVADRDADRVLVTGTCLKGRAQRWYNNETERSTRIIRDWTFEAVIIGLFRAFITTATAQQAIQHYARVKFSREEGVTAFHRELMLWAGRLAQYPDEYSFKRRLYNGLPEDYKHHLALYEGISTEHSSIDDIVQKARKYEKIMISLSSVRGQERPPTGTAPVGTGSHRSSGKRDRQTSRNPQTRQQPSQSKTNISAPVQRSTTKPPTGTRENPQTPPSGAKGSTTKLTCYKCGKIGHISSDPKCPQFKKPERRQMFAAQVIDDRSEDESPDQNDQPDKDNALSDPDERSEHDVEEDKLDNEQLELNQDDPIEGSQYDDEESPYEEFDGLDQPSENDEPIYIRAMHEEDTSVDSSFPQFKNVEWQPRRDEIRKRYQHAPWMPNDALEFTPRDGITHIRECNTCAHFKEHLLITEVCERANSSAWNVRDNYEQDLIHLGWAFAHEEQQVPAHSSGTMNLPSPTALNRELESRNHQLNTQLQALRRAHDHAVMRCNEVTEALEMERLNTDLRAGDADFWQEQYEYAQKRYDEPRVQSTIGQSLTIPFKDEDIDMKSETSASYSETPDQGAQSGSLTNAHMGATPQNETKLRRPDDGSDDLSPVLISTEAIARIAAARDETIIPREREYRAAQNHKCMTGERPRKTDSDRRCMASLVKVNGLEAYALLDSGSTTVSVTHDFARVAKLNIMQLENPVALQLGTVGSRSIINFGARARLDLGPVAEDDAYVDVVNIDRYDMIIGTPFMRKHAFVLDFGHDTFSVRGHLIKPMSSGQEDLMLAKRRVSRARVPATSQGSKARANN